MKKILIVDDHADMRRLLAISAGNEYEVMEAEDGESAFEATRRLRPDAVLLDIMMPGAMDGLQVLDAIRADPALKHIRVAMVTARGQARDYEIGMERGADGYFIKPFSPLQLVAAIKETLAK